MIAPRTLYEIYYTRTMHCFTPMRTLPILTDTSLADHRERLYDVKTVFASHYSQRSPTFIIGYIRFAGPETLKHEFECDVC